MAETEALDIVRLSPSGLNTLASQPAQTLISPASQVSRSQNRKTGVQLKRITWRLPRSAHNPNPATPGGERYRLIAAIIRQEENRPCPSLADLCKIEPDEVCRFVFHVP